MLEGDVKMSGKLLLKELISIKKENLPKKVILGNLFFINLLSFINSN